MTHDLDTGDSLILSAFLVVSYLFKRPFQQLRHCLGGLGGGGSKKISNVIVYRPRISTLFSFIHSCK